MWYSSILRGEYACATGCDEFAGTRLCLPKTLTIINVGRTVILGLPRKQNGRPVGYITPLALISPLKRGVQHLRRPIYGLLTMAVLVGLLMGIKDPGKVQNREWQNHELFLLLTSVGR